jgi:RNA polymerase sigma-70 factor (ECF subfamily)
VAADLSLARARRDARGDGLPRVLGRSAASVEAFQAVYVAKYPALVRYATRVCGDADLAAELAQEAFTRLVARWRDADDPAAYVFVVLTNLLRNHWRTLERERGALRSLLVTSRREVDPADPAAALADAVGRLDPKWREPVLLHYFADMAIDDVARALGRPVGTVKRQLHEARLALHDSLREVPGA